MSTNHWCRPRALLALVVASFALAALANIPHDSRFERAHAAESPANDSWERRQYIYPEFDTGTDLFPFDIAVSTEGATLEPGESASCAITGATVWFEIGSDRYGTLDLRTVDVTFAPVVAVYTFASSGNFLPSPPGGNMTEIACDTAVGPTRVEVPIVPGQQYYVAVGGVSGETGTLRLLGECICAPANDPMQMPGGIYLDAYQPNFRAEFSTERATLEPGEPRPCGDIGATVWYDLYTNSAARIRVDTGGSDFATVTAVYKLSTWPIVPENMTQVACKAGSVLTFDAEQYGEYVVQIGGVAGATGRLTVDVACDPACPPYNDSASGVGVYDLPYYEELDTTGATLEDGEPRPCGGIGKTVWYGVTVRGDSTIVASTEGSGFETVLASYKLAGVSPPPVSLDRLECTAASGGQQPTLRVEAKANEIYWFQAGGVQGAGGPLRIDLRCDPEPCPPYNDSHLGYYDSFDVPGSLPSDRIYDTTNASLEDDEPTDCGDMGKTVWINVYAWPDSTGVRLTTENSDFDTAIAVYRVDGDPRSFENYERIACAEGGAGERATVEFAADPDAMIVIQAGGRGGAGGFLQLYADCLQVCPPYNDNIASALDLYPMQAAFEQRDTRGATIEAEEPMPCGRGGSFTHSVWYRFHSDWDAALQVSTEGSDYGTAIGVYRVDWSTASPPGGLAPLACSRINAPSQVAIDVSPGGDYYIQVGAVDGSPGGMMALDFRCVDDCPPDYEPGQPCADCYPSGAVGGPDTGSGGYLPGARRH